MKFDKHAKRSLTWQKFGAFYHTTLLTFTAYFIAYFCMTMQRFFFKFAPFSVFFKFVWELRKICNKVSLTKKTSSSKANAS